MSHRQHGCTGQPEAVTRGLSRTCHTHQGLLSCPTAAGCRGRPHLPVRPSGAAARPRSRHTSPGGGASLSPSLRTRVPLWGPGVSAQTHQVHPSLTMPGSAPWCCPEPWQWVLACSAHRRGRPLPASPPGLSASPPGAPTPVQSELLLPLSSPGPLWAQGPMVSPHPSVSRTPLSGWGTGCPGEPLATAAEGTGHVSATQGPWGCACLCMCLCMHVYLCVHVCSVCMFACACVCVCICVCMFVCVRVPSRLPESRMGLAPCSPPRGAQAARE